MATGTTLAAMLTMLRAELRDSSIVGHQPDWQPVLKEYLRSAQETLWLAEDWPHLKRKSGPLLLTPGARYYTIPVSVLVEGLRHIEVAYNGHRHEPVFGIHVEHYAEADPEVAAHRRDPIERWDIVNLPDYGPCIEVWPLPATSAQKVYMLHYAGLKPFTDDTHVCTLDDRLIVLHAKADLLAARKAEDAPLAAKKAAAHLELLRGALKRLTNMRASLGPATDLVRRPGTPRAPRAG